MKSYKGITIQVKATEQYFPVVLFVSECLGGKSGILFLVPVFRDFGKLQ